jgi:hypothetical protein
MGRARQKGKCVEIKTSLAVEARQALAAEEKYATMRHGERG